MRRSYLFLALVGANFVLAGVVWYTRPGRAGPAAPPGEAPERPAGKVLPLTRVVLFNSGVGYFQREGPVEGNARVDLSFPATDVNDLIKSLVPHDPGRGSVSAISYDGQEPIERTLKSFALDLTANPTFGEILNQARGEKVEVTLQPSGSSASSLTGVVVGMESQQDPGRRELHHLNLLCAEGMRRVPLEQVLRVRFLNAALDSDFRRALEVVAGGHNSQRRRLSLQFKGEGRRAVKLGYVVESPIWKASYRLALPKGGKPTLQGWAVIENTTDEDWKEVRMALVSGRPLSFQMDLSQPLFVPRPTVEPELFASLRPPVYEGALAGRLNLGGFGGGIAGVGGGLAGLGGIGGGIGGMAGLPAGVAEGVGSQGGGQLGGLQPGLGMGLNRYQLAALAGLGQGGAAERPAGRLTYEELRKRRQEEREGRRAARARASRVGRLVAGLGPDEGLDALGPGGKLGDDFRYTLEQKVTLPRGKSALLPVIAHPVEATPVSIFSPEVHPSHPLLGFQFKNTTGRHLMQGPVSLYEGDTYSGDARLPDLQPGEERLLVHAIDLGTEVKREEKPSPARLQSASLARGFLRTRSKERLTTSYLVRNRSPRDRTLVVEQTIRPEWKVTGPEQPRERSRGLYRFVWEVPARKTVRKEVVEERTVGYEVTLVSTGEDLIRSLRKSEVPTKKFKEALAKVVEHRRRYEATQRERGELEKELEALTQDQARLRANIDKVPRGSAAYKRYLDKFDWQETQIEKLQRQIRDKWLAERRQYKEYGEFVEGLSVD